MRASMPEAMAEPGAHLVSAIETDRRYFELGARLERLPGAVLAWMPDLAATPAGAVIQRVEPEAVGPLWIAGAEQALTDLGSRTARIYLDRRNDALDPVFQDAGYEKREELIFCDELAPPEPGLRLRPVESDFDWERKLQLQQRMIQPPDGHSTPAHDWIALERRKCEEGMEMYLAEWEGEAVGAIGAMNGNGLLRLKNIAVHPAHRRKGVGLRMLGHLGNIARDRGISEQCVFAVRGEIGELLYRAAGMRVIGSVVEWSKRLGESDR